MEFSCPPLLLQLSEHTSTTLRAHYTVAFHSVSEEMCASYDALKRGTRDVVVCNKEMCWTCPSYMCIIQYNIFFFLYLQDLVLYGL